MVSVLAGHAQTAPDWRRIGGSSFDLMLASPATGPVEQVWYSPDGALLYARTVSGRTFQTADFANWVPASAPVYPPVVPETVTAQRLPETGARLVPSAAQVYAVGRDLWRSGDGGRTWDNLTAYKSQSLVGDGLHALAVSPANPDQLVVSNNFGVWRSMDGGMSWTGLNRSLPNLSVERILSTPGGRTGTRIQVSRLGPLELPPGGAVWLPSFSADLQTETALKVQYSALLHAQVSAFAGSGDTVYVRIGRRADVGLDR